MCSAGLRSVEAPGQHCYRIFVDVMSIKSMHSIHTLQFKMSRNVAAAPTKQHFVPKSVVYRQGRSTIFRMPIYPMLNQCQ